MPMLQKVLTKPIFQDELIIQMDVLKKN